MTTTAATTPPLHAVASLSDTPAAEVEALGPVLATEVLNALVLHAVLHDLVIACAPVLRRITVAAEGAYTPPAAERSIDGQEALRDIDGSALLQDLVVDTANIARAAFKYEDDPEGVAAEIDDARTSDEVAAGIRSLADGPLGRIADPEARERAQEVGTLVALIRAMVGFTL